MWEVMQYYCFLNTLDLIQRYVCKLSGLLCSVIMTFHTGFDGINFIVNFQGFFRHYSMLVKTILTFSPSPSLSTLPPSLPPSPPLPLFLGMFQLT